MIGALIAAFLGALAVMALVSAMSGQFSWTRRRALDRAAEFSVRNSRYADAPPAPDRRSLLRSDGVARNQQLSAFFRRWDWSLRRAEQLERADLPLKVAEYMLLVGVAVLVGAGVAYWLTGFLDGELVRGVVIWTGGTAAGQRSPITAYAAAGGLVSYDAITTPPANNDPFVIV